MNINAIHQATNFYTSQTNYKKQTRQSFDISKDSQNICYNNTMFGYNKINVNFKAKSQVLKHFPDNMELWLKEYNIDNRTLQSCNSFWQKAIKEEPEIKELIDTLQPVIARTLFIMQGHNKAMLKIKPYIQQDVVLNDKSNIPEGFYNIKYSLDGKVIAEDGYLK